MLKILSTERCRWCSAQFHSSKLSHMLLGGHGNDSTNLSCRRARALFSSRSSSWHSVYPYSPKQFPQVVAVPLIDRPLFPGFFTSANSVIDPEDSLAYKIRDRIFVGAFLRKDDPGTDPTVPCTIEAESSCDIKGKPLFDRLHKIGTMAMVKAWTWEEETPIMMLLGVGRIQITEMVNEDPLVVKVQHLKDKRFNMTNGAMKTTASELVTIMKDVLKQNSEMTDQAQTVMNAQFIDDNVDYPLLADSIATLFGARSQCQQVLAELDVHKRLQMSLHLAKRELDIITAKKKSISNNPPLLKELVVKLICTNRPQRASQEEGVQLVDPLLAAPKALKEPKAKKHVGSKMSEPTVVGEKRKAAPKGRKEPKMPTTPPRRSYLAMVVDAFASMYNTHGDTCLSLNMITLFIKAKYKGVLSDNFKTTLVNRLAEFVASGRIVKVKRSYKLPDHVFARLKRANLLAKEPSAKKPAAPAKKATPVKKAAPAKKAAPTKKATPVKKAVPVKKAAPVKKGKTATTPSKAAKK